MPSVALQEWRRAPCGLLETILEYRAFAAAKDVVDRATDDEAIPDTPMTRLVRDIEAGLAQQALERRRQRNAD